MALIYLTRGIVTLVDDALYEKLNQHKWYAQRTAGYFRPARRVGSRIYLMYHQVLDIAPGMIGNLVVDHIDRDPLNTTRANLRLVTQEQNMLNSITALNGRGVGYDKTHNRWKAYLPGSPRKNIGTFLTEEDALRAVARAKGN